jgi:L-2-hydroxyglutarate oxidase LhgO
VLQAKARDNGVNDLELIEGHQAVALEPSLRARAALLSPSTGIIDSHGLMLALQGEAEDHGAMIAFCSRVARGAVEPDGIRLLVAGSGGEETSLRAEIVVNAAGLNAQAVAHGLGGLGADAVPRLYLAKGSYFTLAGGPPFARLIYPMPEDGGLGVHVTLDLAGQVRFGPDVEWVEAIDYTVKAGRGARFYAAIRGYYPALADGALLPGYAGIRPKLSGPGQEAADFMIQGPLDHGVRGLVNLYGIESPGLTASLAIADHVAHALELDKALFT